MSYETSDIGQIANLYKAENERLRAQLVTATLHAGTERARAEAAEAELAASREQTAAVERERDEWKHASENNERLYHREKARGDKSYEEKTAILEANQRLYARAEAAEREAARWKLQSDDATKRMWETGHENSRLEREVTKLRDVLESCARQAKQAQSNGMALSTLNAIEHASRAALSSPTTPAEEVCKDCGASGAKACPACGAFTCDGCAENVDESCCPAPIEAPGKGEG